METNWIPVIETMTPAVFHAASAAIAKLAFRRHSLSTGIVNATNVSRPQSIAIVHTEVHCNAEIADEDRLWFFTHPSFPNLIPHETSKFPNLIPQIENHFKTMQLAINLFISGALITAFLFDRAKEKTICFPSS